jgi:hypothetical protein
VVCGHGREACLAVAHPLDGEPIVVQAGLQRVAEQWIAQFGQIVQGTTNLVLPANVGDIGAMIALAMNVFNQQSVKGTPKP